MIKAILLDLDDTLLRLGHPFVMSFLDDMGARMAAIFGQSPDESKQAFRQSHQARMGNLNPTRTVKDAFDQSLARLIAQPLEAIQDLQDTFYRVDYPGLASNITPIAGARDVVADLFTRNIAIAIATNPIFPLGAIRQRMIWAGLNPDLPYALITTETESHFAKPWPHYYEEILARIGVEPDEALMVGDSVTNDILPATHIGMFSFWIDDSPRRELYDVVPCTARGTLAEFADLIRSGWLETLGSMSATPHVAEQVAPRLIGNVAALDGLIRSSRPAHWMMRPTPNEWTIAEIICHLRDSERKVQRPLLQRILEEDNPFIAPPSLDMPANGNLRHDAQMAFAEFWAERQKTLEFLQNLREKDWERSARHSIFGPTTLLEMAHFTARHDHLHLNQLCQTLGRCREI